MAHYAFLDENNIVTEVIVGRDENEVVDGITDWETYYGDFRGQVCKRTSYNTRNGKKVDPETNELTEEAGFRGNYACIDYIYDENLDTFIPPKPTEGTWVLDKNIYNWIEE